MAGATPFDARTLIIRAWRERWSDWEFGSHLRLALKNDCSLADGVTLAQALLNQALVGPGVNRSFLGYLKYCLCCKIVSLTSVLRLVSLEPVNSEDKSPRTGRKLNALLDLLIDVVAAMVSQDPAVRPFSIFQLTVLRHSLPLFLPVLSRKFFLAVIYLKPVSSNPSKRDSLEEGKAFLSIVEWLCKAIEVACTGMDDDLTPDFQRIIDKSARLMNVLLIEDPFRASLIRIASREDRHSARNLKTLASEKFTLLTTALGSKRDSSGTVKQTSMDLLKQCVSVLEYLGGEDIKMQRSRTSPYESYSQVSLYSRRHAVSSLLSAIVQVHLHRDSAVVARWLTNLGLLMGLNKTDIFLETIHSALLLLQCSERAEFSRTLLFFLHKLPPVFEVMHRAGFCTHITEECDAMEAAVGKVSLLKPFLQRVDQVCGGKTLQAFAEELSNRKLISSKCLAELESTCVVLPQTSGCDKVAKLSDLDSNLEQISQYITANDPRNFPEQYLTSLLNLKPSSAALSMEESGIEVWVPLVETAVVTGRLELLVDSCVAICEANESYGSPGLVFDTGFLFLAVFGYIAEDHVSRILQSYPSRNMKEVSVAMTFYNFFCTWMDLRTQPVLAQKESYSFLGIDQKIESFISRLTSDDGNENFLSKTELCWASLAAAKELLSLWEANVLSDHEAEKLFSKLAEASVVSSTCVYAWLVAKIKRKACHDPLKPIAALDIFAEAVMSEGDVNSDLFASLCDTMRKHPDGVDVVTDNEPAKKFAVPLVNRAFVFTAPVPNPPQQPGQRGQMLANVLHDPSGMDAPAFDSFSASCRGGELSAVWKSVMTSSSVVKLTPGVVKMLWQLWRGGSTDWFIKTLLEETFVEAYADELETLVSVMIGLLHLDLESSFGSLTKLLMPQIVISSEKLEFLSEPFASRLAYLFAAVAHCYTTSHGDCTARKMKRTLSCEDALSTLNAPSSQKPASPDPLYEMFDFVKRVTVSSKDPQYDSRLRFALSALKASSHIADLTSSTSPLIAHVPSDLVEWFVKALEPEISSEFICDLVDLSSKAGRAEAAYLLFLKQRVATYAGKGVVMRRNEFGKAPFYA